MLMDESNKYFHEIGLNIKIEKCTNSDNELHCIKFLNVIIQRSYDENKTIAYRLLEDAIKYSALIVKLIHAKVSRHILFMFVRFIIIPRLNWAAFVDEGNEKTEALYKQIDQHVLNMIHNVCISHIVDADTFRSGFIKHFKG